MNDNFETLNFLGTDSGFGKNNNSAFIENDNELILIDCGFTVFEKVIKKLDLKKYKEVNIIVTHLHNDHAGSLGQIILYLWFVCNKKCNVISKCKNIELYLEITGTPKEAYKILSDTKNIKFIKTEHVNYLDSFGFKMNINNKNIIYTGDTKTLEPFIPFLNDVDEFYIDVSRYGGAHLKIDDIQEKLQNIANNNIKIFLMHLDDREYICKFLSNNIFFA
ncbi:MAG: MBL fold metallo-hydrolase [Clostridia bacterium]